MLSQNSSLEDDIENESSQNSSCSDNKQYMDNEAPSTRRTPQKPIRRPHTKYDDDMGLNNVFKDLSNKIGAYFDNTGAEGEGLSQPKKAITPEEAFGQFIGLQLQQMPKEEKLFRQKKMMEALSMPFFHSNQ